MTIILCDRGDEYKVVEEEKMDWVREVLIALGIDAEVIDQNDDMALKHCMEVRDIEVWKNISTGHVEILRGDKIVAQWKPPKLTLKKETPNKWYYEIKLDEWALPFQMKKRGE